MAVTRLVISTVVVVVLINFIDAKLQWKDCGSTGGTVTNVNVEGCEQSTFACSLPKGKNASFSIEFTSKQDATKLSSVVHGVIASIPLPFPLDNPDACKDSNIACPVKSGQTYKYHSSIFVKDEYPKISLAVRWELQDEHGIDVACILLPAKIA